MGSVLDFLSKGCSRPSSIVLSDADYGAVGPGFESRFGDLRTIVVALWHYAVEIMALGLLFCHEGLKHSASIQ
ncbi:hypothetical protein TNCV_5060431 [Trichonephila clavipes]|nr:hypothetical protein TNCV_5060431 [Trichonephila clavipes]